MCISIVYIFILCLIKEAVGAGSRHGGARSARAVGPAARGRRGRSARRRTVGAGGRHGGGRLERAVGTAVGEFPPQQPQLIPFEL